MSIRKIIRESIRGEYEKHGVQGYYEKYGNEYRNPHETEIQMAMDWVIDNWSLTFNDVLDLAAGSGEITKILQSHGYDNVEGIDPYTCGLYQRETNKKCLAIKFEDLVVYGLKAKYDTIICSYAMHLLDQSRLPDLIWQLSRSSKNLLILSPNKKPNIGYGWGMDLKNSTKIHGINVWWYVTNNNLNESNDFQWIKDIEVTHSDLFRGRVEDFIEKYVDQWEGVNVTFEPISDSYNGVIELGRIWMDEIREDDEHNWYWDLIYDSNDDTFIIELFEKWDITGGYEGIDRVRFKTFKESIEWIFATMIE